MNIRRMFSWIWRGIKWAYRFARRRPIVALCIIVVVQLLCILQLGSQLEKKTVEQSGVVQHVVVQEQSQIEVSPLAPEATTNVLPTGKYDIVVAGGGDHPGGEISYSTLGSTCGGGCGSYNGTLELRGIRVVDQGFVLDFDVNISEMSGDPWLFSADLEDIILEVNGQTYKPMASSFPAQLTSMGRMSGYLSFYSQIPVSENIQYHLVLNIQNRLAQPIEGWLALPSP